MSGFNCRRCFCFPPFLYLNCLLYVRPLYLIHSVCVSVSGVVPMLGCSFTTQSASTSAILMPRPCLLWLICYLCAWVVYSVYIFCALFAPSTSTSIMLMPWSRLLWLICCLYIWVICSVYILYTLSPLSAFTSAVPMPRPRVLWLIYVCYACACACICFLLCQYCLFFFSFYFVSLNQGYLRRIRS